jgi:hypothetical protein
LDRYGYRVDSTTAIVVGALLGGVLTVLGGLLATMWLARRDDQRENRRQRARHATAVRIVALELQGNAAALIMRASGATTLTTAAGHDSVVVDLYGLLPDELAIEVGVAYTLMSRMIPVGGAGLIPVIEKINAVRLLLRAYGEKELGLTFAPEGEPASRTKPAQHVAKPRDGSS